MIMEEIRAVLSAKVDALLRRSADDLAALLHPDFVYVNAAGYKLERFTDHELTHEPLAAMTRLTRAIYA